MHQHGSDRAMPNCNPSKYAYIFFRNAETGSLPKGLLITFMRQFTPLASFENAFKPRIDNKL